MRRAAAWSTLEELAELPSLGAEGLRGATLVLRDLIPVDSAVVDFRNPDGDAVGCVGDGEQFDQGAIEAFFNNFYDTAAEDAMGPNCRTLFRVRSDVAVTTPDATKGWAQSDLCREFFSPRGMQELIRVPLWQGTLPKGLLVLGRPRGSRAFAPRDKEMLLRIRSVFERLVDRLPPSAHHGPTEVAGEATWIANRNGSLELSSPGADRLAAMAFGLEGALPGRRREIDRWLTETIRSLSKRLEREDRAVLEVRNGYGFFQIQANWLTASPSATQRARILIRMVLHVPLQTRLFLSPRFRDLPRREKQTVLALAAGVSTRELASQQKVAMTTVLSWIRSLYDRFDVRRRGELIAALLANAGSTQPM